MGKQYKILTKSDIEFIKQQKLFYIASCSGKEVNLSPKGYNTIKVIDETTLIFASYPGSGNRTYTDAANNGEFTIVFNAFEDKPMILRLFCKAKIIQKDDTNYEKYLNLFLIKESVIRNFFEFRIYAVESSCGMSVPIMKYVEDRDELKNWAVDMDGKGQLEAYNQKSFIPPDLSKI
ncbi:MAG: pyridoxamine 5'-phosphate oxidase family protein [Arcobacteraceae bacterium]|nr:pyridoxamine 5'-phosphate oxidase family protein [Arcobacteraceae bacterium]